MVTYNKFNVMVENLMNKVMDLFGSPIGDTLKVSLHSVAPVATNSVFGDLTEIAAGSGYTAGGTAVANAAATRSTGTVTLVGDQVVFTATGAMDPFRYYALYDDTPASPADPLIAWWDHGSTVSLQNGDTFTVKFNNTASGGTILTIS